MDVIAFGRVFLEIVFGQVPSLPGPGEEIFADEFAISCGGAVTVASAASHYGVQAGLSTLLSDDLGSRVVAEHCRRAGVDLSPSRHAGERTAGITVVLNFSGDRGFVSYLPPAQPVAGPDTGHFLEVLRDYRPAWCYLHPWPGAGDAFAGALIAALHQGASVTEAAAAGNAAGSRTVSILGAVGEVDIEGLSPAAAPLAAALLGAQRPAPDEQGGSAARAYGQEP